MAKKAKTTSISSTLAYSLAVGRILLGWLFLWSFLDKCFGLYATPIDRAWVNGGSPTYGFLKGVEGPFASYYHALAGYALIDWLYMVGMAGIGIALILGIGIRIAAVTGAVMLAKIWAASLPLEHNPMIDENIMYFILLVCVVQVPEQKLSLQGWWGRLPFIRNYRWLQ